MVMTVHGLNLTNNIFLINSVFMTWWDHPMALRFFSACALYNNWWPMISALMYVVVPMPCLFFGGGSVHFLTSRVGGGWIDAAKFMTGASSVGSIAIPIILRHAHLIATGAMLIEIFSFVIFVSTVLCFHRISLDDDW